MASSLSSSSSMAFAIGMVEAAIAPLFMVMGFFAWDRHWSGSAFALNLFKCNLAAMGFAVVVVAGVLASSSLPAATVITPTNVAMLCLSSTLGILMGDYCWLEGMRILSARKIILVDSLKPFLAAFLGWAWFDERLKAAAYLGLVLTAGGILVVELEQDIAKRVESREETEEELVRQSRDPTEKDSLLQTPNDVEPPPQRSESYAERRHNRQHSAATLLYGNVVAYLNVILHTFGATLTKIYGVGMKTWLICLIRFGFAGMVAAAISSVCSVPHCLGDKSTKGSREASTPWYWLPRMPWSWWMYVCAGVFCCTFAMPALINDAIFKIPLALLLTLESIGPLYSLPVSWIVQKESPSLKACVGAFLAVAGIAVLSFNGMTPTTTTTTKQGDAAA